MMKTTSLIGSFISIILCIVALHGCTSAEDNANKSSPHNETSTSLPQGNTSAKVREGDPRSFTIEIKKMKFYPEEITVQQGDTVIWINNDMVSHCVTEEKAKAWTSSVIPAGASWKTAVTKGADYYCALHQVMKGKILVR